MTKRVFLPRIKLQTLLAGLALLIVLMPQLARGQHSVIQALNFGEWVVTNNNSAQTATVQTNGSYSNSPAMILLAPPEPGIYLISGLPANMNIQSVDVTMLTPMQSMGQSFTVDNFTTQLSSSNTGPSGETTLTLGARARSSANGNPYPDTTYTGDIMIVLNF